MMGIPIGKNVLYSLHYADDPVILAEVQNDIYHMLRKTDEECAYTKCGPPY